MRIELKEIEQIENYLMEKLNYSENLAFENQLNGNVNLQSNVEFQKNLMEGIKRIGIRNAIKKGKKRYKTKRFLNRTFIFILILASITATVYLIENHTDDTVYCACNEREFRVENQYADYAEVAVKNCVDTCSVFENTLYNNPVIIPENDSLSSDENAYLDQELFEIQTDRDTVIESEDGIIVYIPAHAFNTTNTQVDFIIQVALMPEDVIYAGLNTITENGEELETGGMFYFDAYSKGQRLELEKELTVDIPTDTKKAGMQLYDGIKNKAGELVWDNPKSITKPLIPVDILSLDFYPPNYENKMEGWGYLNKKFKDSLYYSFAFDCPDNIHNKMNENSLVYGEKLFNQSCAACHFPQKDMTGPSLGGARERWIKHSTEENFYAFINNSSQVISKGDNYAMEIEEKWKLSIPPQNLTNTEIDAIFKYVESVDIEPKVLPSSVSPIGMFIPIPQDEMPNNIDNVIKWNFSVTYSGNIATITMIATQKNGWHIYSQNQPDGAIPLPTIFEFTPNKNYTLIGKVEETGAKLVDNDGFPERSFHGNKAIFKQKIKINSEYEFKIDLNYEYMACKTACLPPEFRSTIIKINSTDNLMDSIESSLCDEIGINPASIKTIWNHKFNTTNLATKEFEKRMPWIHKTCDNSILELYVNNLNANLSTVDSMVMKKLGGSLGQKFAEFALLNEGKVEIETQAAKKLNAYYQTKRFAIEKAIALTNSDYWKKQKNLDNELLSMADASDQRNNTNRAKINKQELQYNIDRVYNNLGMKKKAPPTSNPLVFSNSTPNTPTVAAFGKNTTTTIREQRPFIRTNISTMGWKNIDRLMSLRLGQNSGFKGNGRTVTISYSPVEIRIEKKTAYNNIHLYIIPKNFNSYQKLNAKNGSYSYRMNDNLTYDIIVVAWNNNGMFYHNSPLNKGVKQIELIPITKAKWEKIIQTKLASIGNMEAELNYLNVTQKDQYRKNRNTTKQNLRKKIKPFIFPCQLDIVEEYLSDTTATIMRINSESFQGGSQ